MLSNWLIHFCGAALVCAQLAYWSIRLFTPPAASAPPAARTMASHSPDPVLLAREFGDIEHAASPGNIQLAGVFAAGAESAAVFVVNDRPARAVRLGQEVAPGSRLVDVDAHGATLESDGVRRELRVPSLPVAATGAGGGGGFQRQGNVLTAPSVEGASRAAPAARSSPASPMAPAPTAAPPAPPAQPGERASRSAPGGLRPY